MPSITKGRGAAFNPPNRFETLHLEPMEIESADDEEHSVRTTFYKDTTKTILAKNNSPDIPFTYSINPYRGCEHGCTYCYARPSHEYLGFSAGLDFETKILVKHDAPELLEATFKKKSWKPQWICFSGNTDCYQPIERKLELTRRCLEVFLKYRNPVGMITKNHLITRDLDLLNELNTFNLVVVTISITSLDAELSRVMEPRTSPPFKRLETVKLLSSQGIPVNVNVAPLIPGLTDEEIPAILTEASINGAQWANYIMLRLPGAVQDIFLEWVKRVLPDRAAKIINRVKGMHGGILNSSQWEKRMSGEGEMASAIEQLFMLQCKKLGLNKKSIDLSTEHFRPPEKQQLEMF